MEKYWGHVETKEEELANQAMDYDDSFNGKLDNSIFKLTQLAIETDPSGNMEDK